MIIVETVPVLSRVPVPYWKIPKSGVMIRWRNKSSAPHKTTSEAFRSVPKLRIQKSEFGNYEDDIDLVKHSQKYKKELDEAVLPRVAKLLSSESGKARLKNGKPASLDSSLKSTKSSAVRETGGKSNKEKTSLKSKLVGKINPKMSELKQVKKPRGEDVPKLAHTLERVLFSPGVHFLRDPRTRVFNFPSFLNKIVPFEEFDFSKIQAFVSASKDELLLKCASENQKKFFSSTSSMTLTLHQFYLFLNNYTHHPSSVNRFEFPKLTRNATTVPLSVFVEPKGKDPASGETIYSVSSDKSADVEILLSAMGHCLETLLTTEETEFRKYLKNSPDHIEQPPNVYNYLSCGDFLMRSQLDCYDPRLPGNGTFDLKTRAACAIRYDKSPSAANTNYQICKIGGNFESFEREFQDLIRTGGLLKYGFQARIGQMDGIFIAYHNVNTFFGFQYLPLSEIDKVYYSDSKVQTKIETSYSAKDIVANDEISSATAISQFKVSLNIWLDIMKVVIQDIKEYPDFADKPFRLVMKRVETKRKSLRTDIKTRKSGEGEKTRKSAEPVKPLQNSYLQVFAVPLHEGSVRDLQGFSGNFKTSFREDISEEERVANLESAKAKLDGFNKELVEKSPILSYRVFASHFINGLNYSGKGRHPYPRSHNCENEWRYEIKRESDSDDLKKDIKHRYLTSLQAVSQLLTTFGGSGEVPVITELVRKYGDVGNLRKEKWAKEKGEKEKK